MIEREDAIFIWKELFLNLERNFPMTAKRLFDIESRPIRWLVWVTLGVLLVLALLYYEERTLIMDAAYQGFSLLRKDALSIQVNRFGAAFVQAFPLFSARMGLSLQATLWLYSVSFVLEPIICVLILWFGIKHKRMGLAMVLFMTLLVSHTFYWTQSELLQAIVLLLFFFGMIMKWMPLKPQHFLILLPLLSVILFLHPLIFIPFLFIWIFLLWSKDFRKNRWYYLLLLTFFIILACKHLLVPTKPYDASSYKMAQGILEHLGNLFSITSTKNMVHYFITDYFFIIPLWGLITWYYIKKRSWKKLALLQTFFWGYILLINLSYARGLHQYHAESFYRILVVFLIMPLLYDLWENVTIRRALIIALPLVVFIRILNISQRHHIYEQKVHWHRELLQKTNTIQDRKLMLFEKDAPKNKPDITWATPFVTALISTLDDPGNSRTILLTKENNSVYKQYQQSRDVFIGPFEGWKLADFKDPYFHFDTTTVYRLLEKVDLK